MRKIKLLCIALTPWMIAGAIIAVVVATKGQLLDVLLGHEFAEASKIGVVLSAIGGTLSGIVMDCAAIDDRSWWQIGRRVKLHKAVVWSSVACMLLWVMLLLAARMGWGSPAAWLTEGCFTLATYLLWSYVLTAVLRTALRATSWAWREIKKKDF